MKVASPTPLSVNVHLPYRAEKKVLVLALFVKQSFLNTSGLSWKLCYFYPCCLQCISNNLAQCAEQTSM